MTAEPWFESLRDDVATLATLVGRIAFLAQREIGEEHAAEIQREADAIRDALAPDEVQP